MAAPEQGGEDEPVAEETQAITSNNRPYMAADRAVTIFHPLYKECLTCSWVHMNSADFGKGGPLISAIPEDNRKNVYLSFPYGHPDNPRSIVLLTTGQQLSPDLSNTWRDGEPDAVTGQPDAYEFRGRQANVVMSRNSLFGRINASPSFPESDTYLILVHDHSADWGNANAAAVYQQFAKFVAAKVGSATERVVLGGYSRGGAMVAEMARLLRTSTAPLPSSVSVYTGIFDGVAENGVFGVNKDANGDNPIHSDSNFAKKLTDVSARVAASDRKNTTFFFNAVSGGSVSFTTIHAFGSQSYELYPNYWTEHWETVAHGGYKQPENCARLFDPFLTWFERLESSAPSGYHSETLSGGVIGQGVEKNYYLNALSGSALSFGADWNAAANADIDFAIYDPNGSVVATGTSGSTTGEFVTLSAPIAGMYRVRVYSYRGSADTSIYYFGQGDPKLEGQIMLPYEQINAASGWSRKFNLKTSTQGALNLVLTWTDSAANLDLYVKDKSGAVLAQSVGNGAQENISVATGSRQELAIEVRSRTTLPTQFELRGTSPIAP
jgi:hypothetical protein